MTINIHIPENVLLKPNMSVFGLGGAGCNAVKNMIESNLAGVKYVIGNTDAQALESSIAVERKIQLGENLTRGLGAGAVPEVGKEAAEEAEEQIREHLAGSNMVFITAGMGGGTGTGAAPVVARIARELGILTVGVVTKPFHFEGARRMKIAEQGLAELQKYVDTLIVIPNQNLFRIATERTTFADAFKMADNVLHAGVRGITDLMIMPGLINLDFADVRSVMSEMGKAMMGTGEADGEKRAVQAAEAAISNPLLDHSSMKGARGVLINITGGQDMTLFEVDEAANRIRDEVDPDANIIFGSTFNPDLEGKIRVSVVATGIEAGMQPKETPSSKPAVTTSTIPKRDPVREQQPVEYPSMQPQMQPRYNTPFQAPTPAHVEKFSGGEEELERNQKQYDETANIFVAPQPVEPPYNPQPSHPQNLNNSYLRKESSPQPEPQYEQHKEDTGLFSRMAHSVGLKNGQEQAQKQNYSVERETQRAPQDTAVIDEDSLDIPAFLRRKK